LIWPDYNPLSKAPSNTFIHHEWVQVTMKADANTGLAKDDVFYFGNAIGDSGNESTNAIVNANDELGARANQRNFLSPAPVDFAYDFNRDGRVNATDQLIARANQTNFLTADRKSV